MIEYVSLAYVDASCLLAVLFNEPMADEARAVLDSHERLCSSNLLEAEIRCALSRKRVAAEPNFLDEIRWILPNRPLATELRRTLAVGYLKGGDAWHLATALYMSETPHDLPFLTLDRRQSDVAASLGFPTPLTPFAL